MNITAPDFYMGSWQSYVLENPRQCWRVKRLATPRRRDGMLVVKVDPAVPGKPYGFANDMDYVIVACHNVDDSLFPNKHVSSGVTSSVRCSATGRLAR